MKSISILVVLLTCSFLPSPLSCAPRFPPPCDGYLILYCAGAQSWNRYTVKVRDFNLLYDVSRICKRMKKVTMKGSCCYRLGSHRLKYLSPWQDVHKQGRWEVLLKRVDSIHRVKCS